VPASAAARLQRVTWFEVLFDLVAVIAIVQAGDIVSDDLTVVGLARWLLVLALLWWSWTGTALSFRRYVDHSPVARLLVAVQVIALIVVAVTVPTATGVTADAFAWSFFVARLALLGVYLVAEPDTGPSRRLVDRYVWVGLLAATLLPLSTVFSGTAQQALWGLSLLIMVVGSVSTEAGRRHHHPPTASEHMVERYALFTVILLAAAVFKAVTALSGQGFTGLTVGLCVFLGVVILSLGLLYVARIEADVRPSPASVYVWVVAHFIVTVGLALLPVGVRRSGLLEPGAEMDGMVLAVLAAAVAAALLGLALLRAVTVLPRSGVFERPRPGVPAPLIAAAGAIAGILALAGMVGAGLDVRVALLLVAALAVLPAGADLAWPALSAPTEEARTI
jgi:low temperature requirement protein LtrA